jgi:hypothetical protein
MNDIQKRFPYLEGSSITLDEESVTYGETGASAYFWTASIDAHSHDGSIGLKNYGPRVSMSRSGNTALEAYQSLVKAIEAEGWIVR